MDKNSRENKKEIQYISWTDSYSIKKKSIICLFSTETEDANGRIFYDVFTDFDVKKILSTKIFSRN